MSTYGYPGDASGVISDDRQALDTFHALQAQRSSVDAAWAMVDRVFRPSHDGTLLNSSGVWAVGVAVSALFTYATPPGTYWLMAVPDNPADAENPEVRRWLFDERNAVFAYLTQGKLGFYQLLPAFYRQLVTGGVGVMCTEWGASDFRVFGRGYREFYPMYDAYNRMTGCFRLYYLTQLQAEQQFGEALPASARTDRTKTQTLKFIQYIYESDDGRWLSKHYFEDSVFRESFFFEQPWILPRWQLVEPSDAYPTSPALETVGDVNMLQALERVHLRAAQKATDPPMQVFRAAQKLKGIALDPGVLIPSSQMFAATRRAEFEPVPTGDPRITINELQRVEDRVQRAFMIDIMRTLTGRGDASPLKAAEAIGRRQEALAAVSPITMRLAEEWLTKLCQRIHNERVRQHVVPPPPDGLGSPPRWVFTSAAAMAVRASEVDAVSTWLSRIAPLIQLAPDTARAIDAHRVMDKLREYSGVDPDFLVPPDEYTEAQQMDAQLAQAQGLAPAARDAAGALKDLRAAGVL